MIEPMKAVLADKPFSDPNWIFERKLDGIRCLATRDSSGVQLVSRTGRRMNHEYPTIVEALEREPSDDFIADGEIVAFENGITSFSRLQRRGRERVPVFLYLFDLPRLAGEDLRRVPLRERKARLRRAIEFGGPVRFNPHRNGEHGEELYREACAKGLEGVVAKRADSPYLSGGRSRDWLKLKCNAEQELVIGGYTAPKGSREEFGALLVGYYDEGGTLRYAGKVGTGFDHHTLRTLGEQMRKREQDESPFERFKPIPPGTRWVRPELVAQIGFTEWTRDGRLRHPRFLGLRDDKPARDVVREVPS
ncbi:MAG TPA: non-homologous end-joining DNA ligase [Thermoleophilaceae bacterium]|nr:non-homologous end-joining DNA ligase [Thermoleophilaceae bacterium]